MTEKQDGQANVTEVPLGAAGSFLAILIGFGTVAVAISMIGLPNFSSRLMLSTLLKWLVIIAFALLIPYLAWRVIKYREPG